MPRGSHSFQFSTNFSISSKFGIAFKKKNMITYGANPVLYITDKKKDDAKNVYDFICEVSREKNMLFLNTT
ncbi:hypothetical protein BMS3Abin07_02248 [bacterium BMS3Abin07]|nr:hypothetical protein BMS3Abin07_02248 [bacterium BMS3Abin07]